MTLQSNAHPRLRPVMRNGARRCDIEAVIYLTLELYSPLSVPVKAFVNTARDIGYAEGTEEQYSNVLKQMADQGRLYRITKFGDYYYALPVDGVYRGNSESA